MDTIPNDDGDEERIEKKVGRRGTCHNDALARDFKACCF